MKAFTLVNPNWAISEIKDACKKINYISVQDVVIPVISIEDLIKMKMKSNRKQDLADVRYLKMCLKKIKK